MHEQAPPVAGPPPVVRATLQQLVDRAATLAVPGSRRILGITGAPGAGKSTLCAALLGSLGARAALVGMDGFHYANVELARLGRSDRKGAPDTFDVDGYVALLRRLRTPPAVPVLAPVFDRALEEPIGSAVPVTPDTQLVLTEGNYLLLDEHGWSAVRPCLDEVWYLDVPPEVRERRLLRRRRSYGHEPQAAEDWVRTVDGRNGRTVEASRSRADLVVHLDVPETTGDDVAG
ncbi:nucleoside/nucleotide kinase family protein [Blastococcus sp. VKM Ac-2987]|uniref:nucleoside/nucleotide kinase family protein n=1 Tax=Blastococcus sp. VKM Ac-2987 TaxID=3004141 RepID=UPI0022ABB8AA|nr:nucleoside/nucleotide kinase family protein [Blastococcus sp. VKM Ac-2987]MCZ2860320.1 nucleoside/nucleotide kinase family protein [Blastococcus sp. VKM Ac-2987]